MMEDGERMEEEEEATQEQKEETKRVELRQGYRKLMETIARKEDSLVSQDNPEDTNILDCMKQGAELFGQVNAPQELGMDANVVKNLSRICKQQVHQMSANINQFRYEDYVEKLRKVIVGKNHRLDVRKWVTLGKSSFSQDSDLIFDCEPLYCRRASQGAVQAVPLPLHLHVRSPPHHPSSAQGGEEAQQGEEGEAGHQGVGAEGDSDPDSGGGRDL